MVRLATNVTDPIADMLTRIRNANIATKDELLVPASKMNDALARLLTHEGYVESATLEGEGIDSAIRIVLKYGNDFTEYRDVMKTASKEPHVVAVAPFVFNEMMMAHGSVSSAWTKMER